MEKNKAAFGLETYSERIGNYRSIVYETKSSSDFKQKWTTIFILDHRTLKQLGVCKRTKVGEYYNCSDSPIKEWIDYNANTIAFLSGSKNSEDEFQIKQLFDIESGFVIEGSPEDLLEYYNQEFKKDKANKDKKSIYQKKIVIKK